MYPAVVGDAEALAEALAEAVGVGASPRSTSPGISLSHTPKVILALPREVRRKL